MHVKTKGIILHQVKFSDSSNVVNVYTQQFGRLTFMVRGMNKKKSLSRAALLQPLSIVEIDFVYRHANNIQYLKELRLIYPFNDIPFNPVKGSLAMFLVEILYKVLRLSEQDEYLYDFLEKSVLNLDNCNGGLANFHLFFLLQLSGYLGFSPNMEQMEQCNYFDLQNGIFVTSEPAHNQFLKRESTLDFKNLLNINLTDLDILTLTKLRRASLLDALIRYYELHLPDFKTIKSIEVLHDLWN
ncbi:MAG: DNA repair protein RecO [Paludibacteraceae bacterium]